jgi:hypothetical protein
MFILKCGDAVRFVMANALLRTDSKVERIDQPHHYSQHLLSRKTFESQVLVCDLSKLWEMFAKILDLLEFLPLLFLGKLGVIFVLNAPGRVHADRLQVT